MPTGDGPKPLTLLSQNELNAGRTRNRALDEGYRDPAHEVVGPPVEEDSSETQLWALMKTLRAANDNEKLVPPGSVRRAWPYRAAAHLGAQVFVVEWHTVRRVSFTFGPCMTCAQVFIASEEESEPSRASAGLRTRTKSVRREGRRVILRLAEDVTLRFSEPTFGRSMFVGAWTLYRSCAPAHEWQTMRRATMRPRSTRWLRPCCPSEDWRKWGEWTVYKSASCASDVVLSLCGSFGRVAQAETCQQAFAVGGALCVALVEAAGLAVCAEASAASLEPRGHVRHTVRVAERPAVAVLAEELETRLAAFRSDSLEIAQVVHVHGEDVVKLVEVVRQSLLRQGVDLIRG